MLEAIREQSQHTLVWVGLAVIIVVFIFFFGPQSQGMGPSNRVWSAKTDDATIYEPEVVAAFGRVYGSSSDLDQEQYLGTLRQIAMDMGLVYALAERANDAGLYIEDIEVDCYIVNWNHNYMVDGEFPCEAYPDAWQQLYPNIDLRYYTDRTGSFSSSYAADVRGTFNVAVDEYEAYKRAELLALRYLDVLTAGAPITREEVLALFQRRNETVDLEYIALNPTAVEEVTLTPEQVEAFATAEAAAIQAYYDEHIEAYTEPLQVRVRRIYIRKPDADDASAFAEAEGRYTSLLERAQGDEDFEALVREYTELDRERDNAGDMGLNPESRMAADIFAAANELEVGGVAGVEQTYAWNIIRLEEKREARVAPLDEVRLQIAEELAREAALSEAREALAARGARILELAAAGQSLSDAARAEAQEATATAQAAIPAPVPDEEGNLPEVATVTVPALQVELTGAFPREAPNPFAQLQGLDPSIQLPPSPADQIPRIGASAELMRLAFELTDDAPLLDETVEVAGVPYIVRLREHVAADEPTDEQFSALYAELQAQLLNTLINPSALRNRLLAHQGPYPPLLAAILDDLVAAGEIRLNEERFVFVPEDDMAVVE